MGYSTNFENSWTITPALHPKLRTFLVKLCQTRRMARNLPDIYGKEGEFFVDSKGESGQDNSSDIIDYNKPASTQPSLWCQWIPNDEGTAIEWDGGEKFYAYTEWIEYLVNKILAPNGYKLNGTVKWQGEEMGDRGKIKITDNKIEVNSLE